MGEEQDSLLNEEDVCQLRTAGQWIAYKFFAAQSSTLSILGSLVSVAVTLLCWSISNVLLAMKSDIHSPFYTHLFASLSNSADNLHDISPWK